MNKAFKGFAHLLLLFVIVLITIGGIGYWAYKNEQISLTPSQEQFVIFPNPTINPTANWKLTTLEHWEFRVPPDWHYWKCNPEVVWLGPDIKEDQVGNCQGESVTQYMYLTRQSKKQLPTIPYSDTNPPLVVDRKTITIGGKNAFEQRLIFQNKVIEGPVFYIEHEDSIDTIHYFSKLEREIFDQILSTLRFDSGL